MARKNILAVVAANYVGKGVDSLKSLFSDEELKQRVDKDWPLDLRINAGIELSVKSKFIINRDTLKMQEPRSLKGRVIAVSVSDISEEEDESLMQYRAFILPEDGSEDDIFVLEIGVEDKQVISTRLWTLLEEINPSSPEEIAKWLDGDEENYPYIGGPDFNVPHLEVVYDRIYVPEAGCDIIIQEYDEKIISSPFGEDTKVVKNIMCLYGRYLNEEVENSVVEYLSVCALEDEDGLDIELWLGIDILEADVKVI